jgi:hypothetical protein
MAKSNPLRSSRQHALAKFVDSLIGCCPAALRPAEANYLRRPIDCTAAPAIQRLSGSVIDRIKGPSQPDCQRNRLAKAVTKLNSPRARSTAVLQSSTTYTGHYCIISEAAYANQSHLMLIPTP